MKKCSGSFSHTARIRQNTFSRMGKHVGLKVFLCGFYFVLLQGIRYNMVVQSMVIGLSEEMLT